MAGHTNGSVALANNRDLALYLDSIDHKTSDWMKVNLKKISKDLAQIKDCMQKKDLGKR